MHISKYVTSKCVIPDLASVMPCEVINVISGGVRPSNLPINIQVDSPPPHLLLYAYLFVYSFVCPSVHLSIYLSVYGGAIGARVEWSL